MKPRMARRVVLMLPFMMTSCADDEQPAAPPPRRDFPPLRYGYLPPINLNVERVETAGDFVPPSGDDEIIGLSPVSPAETLTAMARDRLKPVGTGGTATFRILNASMTRRQSTLNGVLAVRLDARDENGTNSGFAEARVTATHTAAVPDQSAAIYDMLKSMMFDLNVELEYQIRNKMKSWVIDPPASAQPIEPSTRDSPPPPRS